MTDQENTQVGIYCRGVLQEDQDNQVSCLNRRKYLMCTVQCAADIAFNSTKSIQTSEKDVQLEPWQCGYIS